MIENTLKLGNYAVKNINDKELNILCVKIRYTYDYSEKLIVCIGRDEAERLVDEYPNNFKMTKTGDVVHSYFYVNMMDGMELDFKLIRHGWGDIREDIIKTYKIESVIADIA